MRATCPSFCAAEASSRTFRVAFSDDCSNPHAFLDVPVQRAIRVKAMNFNRRQFVGHSAITATGLALSGGSLLAQIAGDRPPRANDVTVLNPRGRIPVALIIDDS